MTTVDVEFDEEKSARTLAERGFDFRYAARIFDGVVVEWDSHPSVNTRSRQLAQWKVAS